MKLALVCGLTFLPFVAIGLFLERSGPVEANAAGETYGAYSTPLPRLAQSQQSMPTVDTMIGRLAARLEAEPNDPEGWRMLGWSYFQTERYQDSAEAYARAIALREGDAEYRSAYGEALVQVAGGVVTPRALSAFEKTLELDPADVRARYFVGLAKQRSGDQKGALDAWSALIEDAPADAPWLAGVQSRAAVLSEELGLEPASTLPRSLEKAATPAPTGELMGSAQEIAREDRQAMINGMVERLAQRLESDPSDHEGWLRLARSRKVLGQQEAARAALRRAREIFSNSPAVQEQIRATARELDIETY